MKASIAFQKYRILNVITNLRIRRKSEASRPLTVSEKQDVYELLTTAKEDVEWLDVCAVLDIERNELKGVGTLTHDGEERIGNKPPGIGHRNPTPRNQKHQTPQDDGRMVERRHRG